MLPLDAVFPRGRALRLAGAAAVLALAVAADAGAFTHVWEFLDWGAGVLALVSLTSTVLWGLVATDRLLLHSGHRLIAQAVHRCTAVGGLGFLALHIWVKVAKSETGATAAAVPFTDPDDPLLIGLGTLAGYVFLAVAIAGAARSSFAAKGRSQWWRAVHLGAYPAWCAALIHGLKAGRAASAWVTASYLLCLAGVAAVLLQRGAARRRDAAKTHRVPSAARRDPVAARAGGAEPRPVSGRGFRP